jgi:hypothetical protein
MVSLLETIIEETTEINRQQAEREQLLTLLDASESEDEILALDPENRRKIYRLLRERVSSFWEQIAVAGGDSTQLRDEYSSFVSRFEADEEGDGANFSIHWRAMKGNEDRCRELLAKLSANKKKTRKKN